MEFLAPDDNAIVDKLEMDDLPIPITEKIYHCFDFKYDDHINHKLYRCKLPDNYFPKSADVFKNYDDIMYHKKLYVRENLYPDQLAVFEHVTANPKDIVLLQGGPGTGKTFTMLTVGNHFVEKLEPPNAVIFKRDTVHEYRFSANAFTAAKFMMRILHLDYSDYETLERQMSEPMSVEHFLNAVVYLTGKLSLCPENANKRPSDDFRHPLLILDLYTVKPKPFLLVIMMTLVRYRIGAVICGDKNQFQNMFNSTHAGQCSAYDIVSAFSTKTFNLSHNRRLLRCYDTTYNDKVNFIGTLSNDRDLDEWGYALVSAMFYKNLMKNVEPADTILARNHKYLTKTVVDMVTAYKIPTTEWCIKKSEKFVSPIANRTYLDKYLKFLPLIVGNPYFVNEFSERMLCTLKNVEFKDEYQTVTVRMWKTNETKIIKWGICTSVMFEKHRAYLLNNGDDRLSRDSSCDDVYNFPLYPAFIKTIHMSMGRTIPGPVSLILTESCTFQGLYVAMSRVTSSENINSVVIPNQLRHLISLLLNFDVTDLKPLKIGQIKEKMLNGNYVYYDVFAKTHDSDMIDKLQMVAEQSLSLDTQKEREFARENLINLVKGYGIQSRNLKLNINQADDDPTLPFLLDRKFTITGLATLTPLESRVWIHEFLNEPESQEYFRTSEKSIFSEPGDFVPYLKELNEICKFTMSNTYKEGETSMEFMKKTSTQKRKADCEADPDFGKEWKILTENDESPLGATTIPPPNVNTHQCVQMFIHDLVNRDREDSNKLYELLKKRIQNNTKKRTIE